LIKNKLSDLFFKKICLSRVAKPKKALEDCYNLKGLTNWKPVKANGNC